MKNKKDVQEKRVLLLHYLQRDETYGEYSRKVTGICTLFLVFNQSHSHL